MIDRKLLARVRAKMAAAVTEDSIEGYLVQRAKELGGIAVKLLFLPGWPDRMVLLPGGIILFIETKRPSGGKDEPRQPQVQRMLAKLGFPVYKLHTKVAIDEVLNRHAF